MGGIIEIENVTVSYRENVALKNVSLNVQEGTFLGVIGPNGAGKTTLLTAINGLGTIVSGSVKVFGLDLKKNEHRIRKETGYVPQSSNIDPRLPLSVRDVVKIGRFGKIGLFRNLGPYDYQIIETAIKLVGISELQNRPIGHLSSGEQQKVAIARALAQEPKIMLLDEPTSNLDPGAQQELIELINKIYRNTKMTVIFVTHILRHIPDSCKEVIFLKQGKIIHAGGFKESLKKDLLSDLYNCSIEALGL
ncbi:MAG: ABC transporter ATP-binding protein [Deltaproteobacteria bacterium]|nr:ABC transporter ATP-binding protein [Deltaproteobacteria bacterium]